MSWWAVDVRIAPERRESVGAWLVARTGHAVEELADGTLVGFAEDEAAAEQLRSRGVTAEDFEQVADVAAQALRAPPPGPGASWDDAIREAQDACRASAKAKAFLSELMFALKAPADLHPLAHHVGAVLRALALKQALAGAAT